MTCSRTEPSLFCLSENKALLKFLGKRKRDRKGIMDIPDGLAFKNFHHCFVTAILFAMIAFVLGSGLSYLACEETSDKAFWFLAHLKQRLCTTGMLLEVVSIILFWTVPCMFCGGSMAFLIERYSWNEKIGVFEHKK